MSEPIIIKTPQPDTEERLVLVPPGAVSRTEGGDELLTIRTANARDATPDDMARGGWVPSVGYLPRREVETAVSDAMDLQRRLDRMTEVAEQNLERFETAETERSADTIRADAWKAKAIKAEADLGVAESANEEAGELLAAETARAEKAEGLLIQRETELRLAREDGAAVERQMREARSAADASFVRANRAEMRAEKAERERDDARTELARATGPSTEYNLRRERDDLRAELARLTLVDEEEPTVSWFYDTYCARPESTQQEDCADAYRLGVAHERARQQPAKDRATDEELFGIADGIADGLRAIIRAVAARVRQERCLVAQAVGIPLLDSVSVGAVMGGGIRVRIVRRVDSLANTLGETKDVFCERANVPATLARLLGEVSR